MSPKKKKKTKSRKKLSLLDQVIQLTEIPSHLIKKELHSIIQKKNIKPEDLTIEQLRSVAATYLREIMGGLLEHHYFRRQDR